VRTEPPPALLDACATNLSGLWRHSDDDSFRYLARDDGGVLILESVRTGRDGGSHSSEVVLVRTPGHFVGAVGVARVRADAGCAALFPVEVVSCADAGLWVSTVDRERVDAECRLLGQPASRHVHHLVRVAPDAGG
jgi:hypothetical protein